MTSTMDQDRRPLPATFKPGGTAVGGGTTLQTPTSTPPSGLSTTAAGGTPDQTNAITVIQQTLNQYGLGGLASWAWSEITAGASSAQVLLDMYQTPQFQQRFPAIGQRQSAGKPPISPADYVNYEDSLAQMESQYGLPKGYLTNPDTVTQFIAGDTSTAEVQARVQQGFQDVAYAPESTRQFFTQTFGVNGTAALAAHFTDPKLALPLLEQQATAASIGGNMAQGGVNISGEDAMRLAQMGQTGSSVQSNIGQLQQTQQLYDASVNENPGLTEGNQGVEAQFGLSAQASQDVLAREEARKAQFSGGGATSIDQYGTSAGTARTA